MKRAIMIGILSASALAVGGCSAVLGIGDLPDPDTSLTEAGADDGATDALQGTSDSGPANDPDGGVAPTGDAAQACDPTQCQAQLTAAAVTPAKCGEAYCDPKTGACAFRAVDFDGDGHRGAACAAPGLVISKGDDCDDTDKNVYPGQSAACADLPDGGVVAFPGGKPVGQCAYGAKLCGTDGKFGSCAGVKPPGKVNCTSASDNDCDGKVDNTECSCVVNSKQACYTGPAGTQGVGACRAGTQTCSVDASGTSTAWGPCVGQVLPSPDTCDLGNDNSCDGRANYPCTCINGRSTSCGAPPIGARGNCANGTATCAGGNWGACSIGPAVHDTCIAGNDDSCNGSANEGCLCINGGQRGCSAPTGCSAQQTCDGRAWPGSYGSCATTSCNDFTVNVNNDEPCGPACFNGTTCPWTTNVCPGGYHVTSCQVTNTGGHGTCLYDGPNGAAANWHGQVSGCDGTHCLMQTCTCRLNGF